MRVTKWGEFGILCSLFLAQRYTCIERTGAESTGTENSDTTNNHADEHQMVDLQSDSVNANEVAQKQEIPLQYTHQILQRLKKGGIIVSVRGPKGGYRLSRDPKEITLRDILVAAEGDTFEIICETRPVRGESCSSNTLCALRDVWAEVRESVDAVLSSHSLQGLLLSQQQLGQSQLRADQEVVRILPRSKSALER